MSVINKSLGTEFTFLVLFEFLSSICVSLYFLAVQDAVCLEDAGFLGDAGCMEDPECLEDAGYLEDPGCLEKFKPGTFLIGFTLESWTGEGLLFFFNLTSVLLKKAF